MDKTRWEKEAFLQREDLTGPKARASITPRVGVSMPDRGPRFSIY